MHLTPYRLIIRLFGAILVLTLASTLILSVTPILDWDLASTLVSSSEYFWSGLSTPYGLHSGILSGAQRKESTLGVAKKIYVLSLPARNDRRADMERLREVLDLQWSYEVATGTDSYLITDILNSVRQHRRFPSKEFAWPNSNETSGVENVELFDAGYLVPANSISLEGPQSSASHTPLTCSTENHTSTPYSPSLPGYMLLTPPRIACWYSHLSLLGKVANDHSLSEDEVAIILEDDVDMEHDIHQRLEYLWPFLPHDWDLVYLGHCWSDETLHPALNSFELDDIPSYTATFLHPSNKPYCTHAYAISRRSSRKILKHLRYTPFAFSRAIDQALAWLIQSERIKAYSVVPSIVVQRKSGNSNIMPGKGSSWKGELMHGILSENVD